MRLTEDWEFNVLEIENYHRHSRLARYFDFIRENHGNIPGDICEAGVYRGRSLLATALLLKELGSDKKVIGFDSFRGLPQSCEEDEREMFDHLLAAGRISTEHYRQASRFWKIRRSILGRKPTSHTVSACAGDMTDVNLNDLAAKMDFLGLDNIELAIGEFDKTMIGKHRFMAALLDCDLYHSYKTALPFVWDRLSPCGYIHLDEYYSLKFPGARIACDEFFANKKEKPALLSAERGEFERWGVRKNV